MCSTFPDPTFGKVPAAEHSGAHNLIVPLLCPARTLLKSVLTSTRPFPDNLGPKRLPPCRPRHLSALQQWLTLPTTYWELTLKISPNPHSIITLTTRTLHKRKRKLRQLTCKVESTKVADTGPHPTVSASGNTSLWTVSAWPSPLLPAAGFLHLVLFAWLACPAFS